MTNFEKWKSYTDSLVSPDIYINWAWYWAVSAALERRVWLPPEHSRVYASKFVIFVGDPALGKDGPINFANSLLSEHKRDETPKVDLSKLTPTERIAAQHILGEDDKKANEDILGKKNGHVEKSTLFPQASDAVTYEALLLCMARSYRRVNFIDKTSEGTDFMNIYGQSAMYFCIDEMSSLFRKHTDDLVNFFLKAWTCSESYEYTTITRGRDRILRICLNMLAGTTPDFMQQTFNSGLINQGFSSRAQFIYADKNRKAQFFRPELTDEQKQYKKDLSRHIRRLRISDEGKDVYGQVSLEPRTWQLMQEWAQACHEGKIQPANTSNKLKPYYGRKNLHIMKLAMSLHFGESVEMHIPHERFEEAMSILEYTEKSMHLALMVGEDNPQAKLGRKIVSHLIVNGPTIFDHIWLEFVGAANKKAIEEVLEFLEATNQITAIKMESNPSKEMKIHYKVI